jgi:hypothetical protein
MRGGPYIMKVRDVLFKDCWKTAFLAAWGVHQRETRWVRHVFLGPLFFMMRLFLPYPMRSSQRLKKLNLGSKREGLQLGKGKKKMEKETKV